MRLSITLIVISLALHLAARADQILLVAGGSRDAVDIQATEALLREPFGAEFDAGGHLWIIEMISGNRLLQVDGGGMITHFAGNLKPGFSGDGGPALRAQFNGPHNFAILPSGNILIGDTWNGCIREVDVRARTVNSLRGWQVSAEKARGSGPYCITLDFTGTKLYIADLHQIHELDLGSGKARIIAGNGKKGLPKDGELATAAPLADPRAVAPDRLGNVYILERGGNALRVVDKDGRIKTVVNSSGKKGAAGDGGLALDATMNGPKHLCVDKDNTVIIADAESHLVRRYIPATGKIERIAGTGVKGSAGVGGDPLNCQLARPHGVTVHPATGELYITDSYNNRILQIQRQ